jgi:hypothetical protein
VVEIDPEAAVEFEDGKWAVGGAGLLRRGRQRRQENERQEQKKSSSGGRAHVESHDSSANSSAAQIRDSFFSLFRNRRCTMPAHFGGVC